MQRSLLPIITLLLLTAPCLGGCNNLGYYYQAVRGQIEILRKAEPIAELLTDPATPPPLRQRLLSIEQIRDFAVSDLLLPDNASYRSYADLQRPYVVWNVVASAEFSVQPKTWCFPVAGCVSYKGFFREQDAEQLATALRGQHYDVDLYGVQAYSTLNWFADPILNTFVMAPETRLAGLIFHELAHQRFYVKGDSPFNEAFAQVLQIEGVRRWLQQRGDQQQWLRYQRRLRQQEVFQAFLRQTRQQLEELYQSNEPAALMRRHKQEIIDRALEKFTALQAEGVLDHGFDRWMAGGLNNARLAAVATYHDLLPGLQQQLKECGHDLPCFYQRVEELGELSKEERTTALQLKRSAALDQ